MSDTLELPDFLSDYSQFKQHLDTTLENSSPKEKGDKFAEFSQRIIPFLETGIDWDNLRLNQASHDGGVDIIGDSSDKKNILYGQSKLSISKVDDLDLIFSKFEDFYQKKHCQANNHNKQLSLFGDETEKNDVYFLIITSTLIGNLIKKFAQSPIKSSFYHSLQKQNKIFIIDGESLLPTLQKLYRQSYVLPSRIQLDFEQPPLRKNNVYVGIISSVQLNRAYNEYGNSLFLDNIRDFLGFKDKSSDDSERSQRQSVNNTILHTVMNEPEKMLARNNGITFKADTVEVSNQNTLILKQASIVNGCQSTMCMMKNPSDDLYVVVKIVETHDSWDIAKSANFQNEVKQIKLELASYIRPQIVKKAASFTGEFKIITKADSVFEVLEAIYKPSIVYDEIYALFSGIFSNSSSNIMNGSHADLRSDLLQDFYNYNDKHKIFQTLFHLYNASSNAKDKVREIYNDPSYAEIFQRFWKSDSYNYRAFLSILASCSAVKINIYDRAEEKKINNFQDILGFFKKIDDILESKNQIYDLYYESSFYAVATYLNYTSSNKGEDIIRRDMNRKVRAANFSNLYSQTNMNADRLLKN